MLRTGTLSASPEGVKMNLVPDLVNPSPDYFCTWNLQGYVSSYASMEAMRNAMLERYVMGSGRSPGWADMYPKIRRDLLLVLDDSWDVPPGGNIDMMGSLVLDPDRFPSFEGTPSQRLSQLRKALIAKGWKGMGVWVCAQQAAALGPSTPEAYWRARLGWARESGLDYWKVDWGVHSEDPVWRRSLTDWARIDAPGLVVEHALVPEVYPFSDVYRSYDVEVIISIAETIRRAARLLAGLPISPGLGLVNCEDEVYIGAALGCALGIMRHGMVGALPNGRQDFAFPPVGRDIKRRLDEVVRAVRWHRIAPAFGGGDICVDPVSLTDYWILKEDETWTKRSPGDRAESAAPARVSRGLPLAEVTVKDGTPFPFVLASRHPEGSIAVATQGRTLEREYIAPLADVVLRVPDVDHAIGIFGFYQSLTLSSEREIPRGTVWAQDLAGELAVDVTDEVHLTTHKLVISGKLIQRIGLMAQTAHDLSEPGMVLTIKKE